MTLPPLDTVYEHLCVLRDAERPTDPRHDRRWREVARWLEQAFSGKGREDARQEALLSLFRNVRGMRAQSPLQAAKWVSTIVQRKHVDAMRARGRDPVHDALAHEPRHEGNVPSIDRLVADDASADPRALESLVTTVLEHVHRALEETEPHASKRLMRRTQAHATLLRLACGADAEAIAAALDHGEPLGKDRIYKWVERGRSSVELGLDRWQRLASDEERAERAELVTILRELIGERRADAGVPRPERRKDRAEDPP